MTMADVNGDSFLDIIRYDFMWPDGTTETLGPAKFTTYLDQPSSNFAQSSSYAPYSGTPLQSPPYLQFGDPETSSMVADLNGDGKPDEIAFQRPFPLLATSTLKFSRAMVMARSRQLSTFSIFKNHTLFRHTPTLWTEALFSDLIELDRSTTSMHVFKGGPAPAVQLALEEEPGDRHVRLRLGVPQSSPVPQPPRLNSPAAYPE